MEPNPEVEKVRAQIGRVKAALLKEDSALAYTLFQASSGLCIAAHALIRDIENNRSASSGDSLPEWTRCHHEWREVELDSPDGYTAVRCRLCRCLGERLNNTGDVFWPAT